MPHFNIIGPEGGTECPVGRCTKDSPPKGRSQRFISIDTCLDRMIWGGEETLYSSTQRVSDVIPAFCEVSTDARWTRNLRKSSVLLESRRKSSRGCLLHPRHPRTLIWDNSKYAKGNTSALKATHFLQRCMRAKDSTSKI